MNDEVVEGAVKNQPLTRSEKISLGTKEIARRIREQIRKEFKDCVFSVVSEYYSMGSSIHISLMRADFKVIKDFKDISEQAINTYINGRTKEQLKEMQESKHHQLNHYQLRETHNPLTWCNGVFLTEKGQNLFKKIVEIVDYYNYDDSDIQTDYFDTNFYLHLNIGKWNKPFIDGV